MDKFIIWFNAIMALLIIFLILFLLAVILPETKPKPRAAFTEHEKKLFFCITDGFTSGTAVYNFPEKPYVMWKKKIVYLDKTKCERKCK